MTDVADAGTSPEPGTLMRAEADEGAHAFTTALATQVPALDRRPRAIYTIARGSSDAAACILSYEIMSELGIPATSLPPSAFSLLDGVDMTDVMAWIISQSGGSDDLVRSAEGVRARGGRVAAILNTTSSPVADHADLTVPISAGPERAVPATKSVMGSIGAGMALIAALKPDYRSICDGAAEAFARKSRVNPSRNAALQSALLRAQNIYVIGRGSGFGAAQEVALKLKETCALHAEAYSASEVLHGPLQLVTKPLTVLILDTGSDLSQPSIDAAEARFQALGSPVYRVRAAELTGGPPPASPAAAALLLDALYPVILETALALGYDPDRPDTLAKVTRTI